MTHPMIEKCARVLEPQAWRALGGLRDSLAYENRRKSSIRKAIAVLRALKEPDEGMVEVGGQAVDWIAVTSPSPKEDATDIFTAMVDHILTEEKGAER